MSHQASFVAALLTGLMAAAAGPAGAVEFTHQEFVRGRSQTAMPDTLAPAVLPRPGRSSFLEGNARFRLQDDGNYAALAGDLSAYMRTDDKSYQAVPNELYVDAAPHPLAGFVIGRRKLLYGSGMAVNPTDWLNVAKDPLNPQAQRVGAYLAAAEARTENVVVTALFAPTVTPNEKGLPAEVAWDQNLMLGRVYILAAETDINLLGGYQNEVPRAGVSASRYVWDVFELHVEAASRQGSARQVFDRRFVPFLRQLDWSSLPAQTGTPPFLSQPDVDSTRWYTQALAGTRWMSENGDMVSLEYLWNREGLDSGEWASRMAVLRVLPAGRMPTGAAQDPAQQFAFQPARRNYVFFNASRARLWADHWLEDFSANAAVAANIDRQPSALLYPTLAFKRGQHMSVSAGVAVPAGSPDSEFGSLPIREMYVFEINAFF